MSLSFGEMSAIQDDWQQYKRKLFNDAEQQPASVEDIDTYIESISDVYSTEEEQEDVMGYIQLLEMSENNF